MKLKKKKEKRSTGRLNFLKLSNVKIGWKYGIVLITTIVLFIVAASIVYTQVKIIESELTILENKGESAIAVTDMGSIIRTKDIRIADYIREPNDQFINEFNSYTMELNSLKSGILAYVETDKQKELLDKIIENDNAMNDMFINQIVPAVKKGDIVTYSVLRDTIQGLRTETVNMLEQLRAITIDQRNMAVSSVHQSLEGTILVLVISIIAAAVFGGVFMVLVNRLVKKHLNSVIVMATSIADGNLKINEVNYKGKDEIGQLSLAMNNMYQSLRTIIQNIQDASNTVSSQSEELMQSSNEVTEGATQIVATMEQLSSGADNQARESLNLEQLMRVFQEKVDHANTNSQNIANSTEDVLQMTAKGSGLMQSSIDKMNVINGIVMGAVKKVEGLDKQSKQISKLVEVIKDVADQTNLLALNAAIEASRAGEHGRGFAVVAEEVRKLAEEVSKSVKEITGIVDSVQKETNVVTKELQRSYEEVNEGTEQVTVTGRTFTEIEDAVSQTVERIKEIARNLEEISESSKGMNQSIESIASISQESAAGIEQTSASIQQTSSSMEEISKGADSLSKLSEDLNGSVRKFQL